MKCTIAGCTNNKGKGISASAESGSNLNKHLRSSHKPDAERLIAEIKNKPSSSVGGGDLSSSDQTRIEHHFGKPEKAAFDALSPVVHLITSDFLPFSIVEGEGFRNYSETLRPGVKLPSRKTVVRAVKVSFNEIH